MGMHGNKKLYGTATIGSKGQVVIPAEAREELNLQPGDRLYVLSAMDKGVVFLKEEALEQLVQNMSAQVEGFRDYKKLKNESFDD